MIERITDLIYHLRNKPVLELAAWVTVGGTLLGVYLLTERATGSEWVAGMAVGVLVLATLVLLAPRTRALALHARDRERVSAGQIARGAPRYVFGLLLDAICIFGSAGCTTIALLLVIDDMWSKKFWIYMVVGVSMGVLVRRIAEWIAKRTGLRYTELHLSMELAGFDPKSRASLRHRSD